MIDLPRKNVLADAMQLLTDAFRMVGFGAFCKVNGVLENSLGESDTDTDYS